MSLIFLASCVSTSDLQEDDNDLSYSSIENSSIVSTLYDLDQNPFFWNSTEISSIRGKYYSLMNNNGGCRLPCIWGISPGEEMSFLEFFVPGNNHIEIPGEENFQSTFLTWDTSRLFPDMIFSGFSLSEDVVELGANLFITHDEYYIANGMFLIVSDNSPYDTSTDPAANSFYQEFSRYYQLSSILSIYGEPDHIFFGNYPGDQEHEGSNIYHSTLILVYEGAGFAVEYDFLARVENDTVVGCPQNSAIMIISWNALERNGFEEGLINLHYQSYTYYVRPIDYSTEMNIQSFTQIYQDINNPQCLITDRDFWPTQ